MKKKPETELVRICSEYNVSPIQRKGITTILESDPGTTKEKLAEAIGITAKTLWMWHKQKKFLDALADCADIIIKGEWPHILKAIAEKAKEGDVNAAKWIGEITGRYQSKAELKHTGKVEQEHTGSIDIADWNKEEAREAIRLIRDIKAKRTRAANIN